MTAKSSGIVFFFMVLGAVLGALAGYLFPNLMRSAGFIGDLFIHALLILALPLIVAALVSSMSTMNGFGRIGRGLGMTVGYFAATTLVAVAIGLILAAVINPGGGYLVAEPLGTGANYGVETSTLGSLFSQLIPSSLPGSLSEGRYLGAILLAMLFGGALAGVGGRTKVVQNFFREFHEAVIRLVPLVMAAAPVAFFFMAGSAVAVHGGTLANLGGALGWFGLVVVIGLLVHAVIILPLTLRFFNGRSVTEYLADIRPALATGFFTNSPVAAFSPLYDSAISGGHVDRRAGSIVLPLGSIANLNGTALVLAAGAVFIGQVYGLNLTFPEYLVIGFLSTLVAILSAGSALAASALLALVLTAAGYPPEAVAGGVGILGVTNWLLLRLATVVDIWGDAVGAAVVSEALDAPPARFPRAQKAETSGRGRERTDRRTTRGDARKTRGGPGRRPDDRDRSRPKRSTRTERESRPSREPRESRDSRGGRDSRSNRERPGRDAEKQQRSTPSPFQMSATDEPPLIEGLGETARASMDPGVEPPPPERSGASRDWHRKDSDDSRQRDRDKGRGSRRSDRDRSDNGGRSHHREERPGRQHESKQPDHRRTESHRDDGGRISKPEASPDQVPAQEHETHAEEPAPKSHSAGRLNPATVARELARVQNQLSSTGSASVEEDRPQAAPVAEPAAQELTVASDDRRDRHDRQDHGESHPSAELAASNAETPEETPEAPRVESAPESKAEDDRVTERDESEQTPDSDGEHRQPEKADEEERHFGRSRSHRGDKLRRESDGSEESGDAGSEASSDDAPEAPEAPEVKEGYSTEEVSFGRGKRKRTR